MSTTALESVAASRDVPRTESIILKTLRPVHVNHVNRTITKGDDDVFSDDVHETVVPTSTTPPVYTTRNQRQLDPTAVARIKRRENFQFAALCVPLFLAGYNDGSISFN